MTGGFLVGKWGRVLRWLVGSLLSLCLLLWLVDRIWPLPLPKDDLARVVLAEDGTPLWRFADANGVWRYPVTVDQVSPYYLEALLTYEDRWFYQHPGVNPMALVRATWQNLSGGHVVSGGSTLSMQVAWHLARCGCCQLGVSGQIPATTDARRRCIVGGTAAGAEPVASRSSSSARASGAGQSAEAAGRVQCLATTGRQ
jgi:hypothetical protein